MRTPLIAAATALLVVGCASAANDDAANDDVATPTDVTVDSPATATSDPPDTTASTPADTTTTTSTTTTTAATTTTTAATTTTVPALRAPSVDEVLQSGVPLNLAHAGGDQAAPHSTMFAFREAVLAGADALELDVQLTADGVLIVQHDDTVDKTTETVGPVGALTLVEIQALDNGFWYSPQNWPARDRPVEEYVYRGVRTGTAPPPAGYSADDFRVITFTELAEAFPEMLLDIEIKGSFPDALPVVEQLAVEIEALDRADSVVVVSFDDQIVDAFHERMPDVAVSPGLGRLTDWFLNGTELEPHFEIFQLPPFQGDIEVINADTVARIHDEGHVIWAWADDASTQENAEFYSLLLGYGVDGIITGRPAAMVDALAG